MPFVTLWALACLNASACVKIEVPSDTAYTMGVCFSYGERLAQDYLKQHPTYGRPNYHFGGWKCQIGNKPAPKQGAA